MFSGFDYLIANKKLAKYLDTNVEFSLYFFISSPSYMFDMSAYLVYLWILDLSINPK